MTNTKEQSIAQIKELIEEFRANGQNLKEENTKIRFVVPLFQALGWNVKNLSFEDNVATKSVDMTALIDDTPQFYIEIKGSREELGTDENIGQAINYAWLKGITWAGLTNFKELFIFNAEVKYGNNNLLNSFKKFNFEEYAKNEDLWLLSRESLQNGTLDAIAEKSFKKLERITVSDQIGEDLTNWSSKLERDIRKNNKIDNEELFSESIQRIINRLIFIRTCEDRKIYAGDKLIALKHQFRPKATNSLYKQINELYKEYDRAYNSKLFTYNPDRFDERHYCEQLEISDNLLLDIIGDLYKEQDPTKRYDFSKIDADILGSIYEQYLAYLQKRIPKDKKEEAQKTKRKMKGIYYTPKYITEFITKNTVGEFLKKAKEQEVKKLKIIDPACGSGSFLIKSFDAILGFYKNKLKSEYKQAKFTSEGETQTVKKEILKHNLFGVDIDEKAVEIAQLNLLLKAAHEKQRLPTLVHNIERGNSIISEPTIAGERAFNWASRFSDNGEPIKFNFLVGNPPYNAKLNEIEKEYLREQYPELKSGDTAEYFFKRAETLLCDDGIIGFIVPKSIAYYESWAGIRKTLFENFDILNIADVGAAFSGVNLEEIIIIAGKKTKTTRKKVKVTKFSDLKTPKRQKTIVTEGYVPISLMKNLGVLIFTPLTDTEQEIIENISKNSTKFSDFIEDGFRGLFISDDNKQKLKTGNVAFIEKEPWLQRYGIENLHNINTSESFINQKWVARCLRKKLIFKVLRGKRISVHCDLNGNLLTPTNINNVILKQNTPYSYEFLAGLFNSKLFSFYIQKSLFSDTTESARHLDQPYLRNFPIPVKVLQENKIKELVLKQIKLKEKIFGIKSNTDEKRQLEMDSLKIDEEIDEMVYDIYKLNNNEKEVVKKYFN